MTPAEGSDLDGVCPTSQPGSCDGGGLLYTGLRASPSTCAYLRGTSPRSFINGALSDGYFRTSISVICRNGNLSGALFGGALSDKLDKSDESDRSDEPLRGIIDNEQKKTPARVFFYLHFVSSSLLLD